MDSQHRHELEQNDLERVLGGTKEWITENQQSVLWGLIIIAVVVGGFVYYAQSKGSEQAARYELWDLYATAQTPGGLDQILENASAPADLVVLSHLKKADMLLEEGLQPGLGSDSAQEQKKVRFEQAIDHYDNVINNDKAKPLVKYNAMLGKASAAESLRQWDDAESAYQSIVDAAEAYPAIMQVAKARLAALDRIKVPVTFAPDVKPKDGLEGVDDDLDTGFSFERGPDSKDEEKALPDLDKEEAGDGLEIPGPIEDKGTGTPFSPGVGNEPPSIELPDLEETESETE